MLPQGLGSQQVGLWSGALPAPCEIRVGIAKQLPGLGHLLELLADNPSSATKEASLG